jgi:hypothetical protein
MESAVAVVVVGMIVFLAHLFAVGFEKTRIPDVLPLGYIREFCSDRFFTLSNHQTLAQVGQVFTTLSSRDYSLQLRARA